MGRHTRIITGHALAISLTASLILLAGCSDSANVTTDTNDDGDAPTPPFQVATEQGPVQGVEAPRQVSYKGIRYAAAPTGERRFAPPAPAPMHDGVLEADAFGSPCPQGGGTFGQPSDNEDCLFLNVYTPKTGTDHPVMVWIHGGAFETGSGGANYNPVRLVQEGTVVVTINYRLNAFGFLAHPLLSGDDSNGGSGDYGILDQQAALGWVQDNIENFGGNPDNVTIFGESAGGHSVLTLLASPLSDGLFDRAIVQSGAYRPNQFTLEEAEQRGQQVVDALDCDTLACLRSASVADILAAGADVALQPNTRPGVLPNSIADVLASGDYNQVPVIIGSNADEGQLFVAIQELTSGSAIPPEAYRPAIAGLVGAPVDDERVDRVIDTYPISAYENTAHALAAAATDATFACNSLAESRALAQNVPTFAYEFADRDAPSLLPPSPSFSDYGAAHAYEIAYVINTEEVLRQRGAGDAQIALSNQMIDYWTNFARNGDPNAEDGTGVFWPRFTPSGDTTMIELVAPTPEPLAAETFSERHHCDLWLEDGYSSARL